MKQPQVYLIYATDLNGVIGKHGSIPWHSSRDFKFFKELTMGSAVVMGRKTWESLPTVARPLPGRRNFVVSRNPDYLAPGAEVMPSLEAVLAVERLTHVFVIGGKALLEEAAHHASLAYISKIGVTTPLDEHCLMEPVLPPHKLTAVKKLFEGDDVQPSVTVWSIEFIRPSQA